MELLAPICEREKSSIHSRGFSPPEASLPAVDGGGDRLSTEAFLPWSDLVCPLLMQASYSSLPVLPQRRTGDALWVDLMASQIDFQFLTTKTVLWFARVVSQNASQARTTRGSIYLTRARAHSWVQSWPQYKWWVIKGWTTTKMPLLSVTTPVHVIAKEVVEGGQRGKSDFCPQATRANPSSSFPDSTKGISRELRQKPPESLLWPTNSYHYQRKKSTVRPIRIDPAIPDLCPQKPHGHQQRFYPYRYEAQPWQRLIFRSLAP